MREFWLEFCNFAVTFLVYVFWPYVLIVKNTWLYRRLNLYFDKSGFQLIVESNATITVNPLLSPPGGLFFSSTEGSLKEGGAYLI